MTRLTHQRPHWPAASILALAALGDALLRSARLFLTEQALCRTHYEIEDPSLIQPDGSVDELRCKSNSIQADLSLVFGVFEVVTLLSGLVATPVLTRMVQTIGRRNVLYINLAMMTLSPLYYTMVFFLPTIFNVRMIWLAGLFELVGGGMPLRNAILYIYIAEVVPTVALSETLYRLSTLFLLMSFLGTALASLLLNVSAWLLSLLAIGVCGLALPFVFFLVPSRRTQDPTRSSLYAPHHPLYNAVTQEEDDSGQLSLAPTSASVSTPQESQSVVKILSIISRDVSQSSSLLLDLVQDPLIGLTMLIYLCDETAIYIRVVFPQWTSKNFGWTLAEANAITSFQIVVNGVVLLALPLISRRILLPLLVSQRPVDFTVIRCSLIFNLVGIFCVGVAPNRLLYMVALGIYNLGAALPDSLRSYVTSTMRDEEELQRLYTGITMVEAVAGLIGTTLWSTTFSAGVRYGGISLGRITFFAAAALFCISLYLTKALDGLATMRKSECPEEDEE